MKNQEIRLSPSTLNLFLECPNCFWDKYRRGIERPEGYHSTLLNRMDKEIKEYFNKFRGSLPPELESKVVGELIDDLFLLRKWQNSRSPGLIYYLEPQIRLAGALDDCLVVGKTKYYIPIEFKTKGKDISEEPIPPYYQNQIDCYTLLLEKCGYRTKKFGYLVYYILEKVEKNGIVRFNVEVVKVEADLNRVLKIIKEAVECLRGSRPKANLLCPYCRYREL